jgi:hypothetical protein
MPNKDLSTDKKESLLDKSKHKMDVSTNICEFSIQPKTNDFVEDCNWSDNSSSCEFSYKKT